MDGVRWYPPGVCELESADMLCARACEDAWEERCPCCGVAACDGGRDGADAVIVGGVDDGFARKNEKRDDEGVVAGGSGGCDAAGDARGFCDALVGVASGVAAADDAPDEVAVDAALGRVEEAGEVNTDDAADDDDDGDELMADSEGARGPARRCFRRER